MDYCDCMYVCIPFPYGMKGNMAANGATIVPTLNRLMSEVFLGNVHLISISLFYPSGRRNHRSRCGIPPSVPSERRKSCSHNSGLVTSHTCSTARGLVPNSTHCDIALTILHILQVNAYIITNTILYSTFRERHVTCMDKADICKQNKDHQGNKINTVQVILVLSLHISFGQAKNISHRASHLINSAFLPPILLAGLLTARHIITF